MKQNLNFEPVYMPENNEDTTMSCEICSERLASPENQIVFCELCNVGVHQFCYGFPLSNEIPEGDWHCDRCKFCIENGIQPEKIKCVLCSYSVGSMKKIKHNKWVHIICVNWIPEIYFENFFEKNTLSFMDQTNFKKRKNKMCYLCGSREGYCISCEFTCKKVKCQKFYHVYCARKSKVIFSERLMSIYLFDLNNKYIKTFCLEHLRKEFMKNKEFGLEEGLQKEKDDKIQKEIIKNRTNLDDTQIKPEIYQDFEEEEFKFQYEQILSYLLGQKEKKNKVLPQTSNNFNIVNINGKKFKSRNKENEITFFPPPARKKIKPETSTTPPSFHSQPNGDTRSDSENNNISMNCIEEAISETELSEQDHTKQHHHLTHENYTKLNHQASINHINTMQHRQDHNMADKHVNGTPHNQDINNNKQNNIKQDCNTSQKNDQKLQHKDHTTKQLQENVIIQEIDHYPGNFVTKAKMNGFLEESGIFETVEVDIGNELQIGENSPQYENRHDDKNNDLITVGSSDSEKGDNINNIINEFDDDFYYQKDFYKRFEAVDRLHKGKILSVETLKENQTFQSFFENQHYCRSKIEYLDNPFSPKPVDKIQINDLEILDIWNEKIDLGNISRKLLGYMRKKGGEDIEIIKNQEKNLEKKTTDLEFITKISDEFVFQNAFDFEGIPYLHNDK